MSETTEETPQTPPRSPFAGCLILVVMLVVVLVLIATAGYSVKQQTEAFKEFTETEAVPAPIADLGLHEEKVNSLVGRISDFGQKIDNKKASELAFTAEDLNLAIAKFDELKEIRGQIHFDKITAEEFSGTIHRPLRSTKDLPEFVRGPLNIEPRDQFLNGTFTGKPLLTDGKLILYLNKIDSSKGTVPDDFFQSMSRILISAPLEEDEEKTALQVQLDKLTSATLREGEFILIYSPGTTPPSIKEETNAMTQKATQLVALGAVILILTMILLFIVLSRRKKARQI